MSKRHRKKTGRPSRPRKHGAKPKNASSKVAPHAAGASLYQQALTLVGKKQYDQARGLYQKGQSQANDPLLQARYLNDLAVLAAVTGDYSTSRKNLEQALLLNPEYELARQNLALLPSNVLEPCQESAKPSRVDPSSATPNQPVKVALLSFLFNWPTGGGGNIHTAELGLFLRRAGYQVQHYYPCFPAWQIGQVECSPIDSQPLPFTEGEWTIQEIQTRFRQAVDRFAPDFVLITDCWNFKPHLAAAMRGYPTFLRFQALESLCPLNNIRLLPGEKNQWHQCPLHQLATPKKCWECLQQRGHFSGTLHQAERQLSQVGTEAYQELLRQVLQEAEAVLVLNPLTEAMLSPFARRVEVVTWGMDPARFPWPPTNEPDGKEIKTIFQAGVITEPMKGFAILHAACAKLWQKRQDFRLMATGLPAGQVDEFTEFVGWVSQEDLPRFYQSADIVAVPTVAQEGLSRTSVEAMASGKAVLASRIGGLPFSVNDGATGLLCEPGHVEEWCQKLEILLSNDPLRKEMGQAGRKCFEERFAWDKVIERYYRPLFTRKKSLDAVC